MVEVVEKKSKIKIILLSAIFLGVLIIILYSAYMWNAYGANPIQQINSIFNSAKSEDYDMPAEPRDSEESGSNVGGNGSGAGSGGSSSGGGIPLTGCSISSILYSLEDITKKEICNSYVDEICIDKTISCSAEIHNRDSVNTLLFSLKLYFVENEKSTSEYIKMATKDLTISPSSFEIFNETLTVQSSGQEGIANKIINCFYNTAENPTREC